MAKQLGGFDVEPPKNSFAARVARANAHETTGDTSTLTEEERSALTKASDLDKAAANFKFVEPTQALERVEIVFDNSGSMGGDKIKDAKEGVTEFMKACTPNETAVRVSPVDSESHSALKFTTNLPTIAESLKSVHAAGGTPLYSKLLNALGKGHRTDLYPTRIIAFSDGDAQDGFARREETEYNYETRESVVIDTKDSPSHIEVVALSKEKKVVIDTCYIFDGTGKPENDRGYKTMKALADDTGGVFILFEKGKCDFRRGFKYLTKGNRLLLMDKSFKSKLEAGEIG